MLGPMHSYKVTSMNKPGGSLSKLNTMKLSHFAKRNIVAMHLDTAMSWQAEPLFKQALVTKEGVEAHALISATSVNNLMSLYQSLSMTRAILQIYTNHKRCHALSGQAIHEVM